MSVYRAKKSPYWQYDFTLPDGRRFYGSTGQKSKTAAKKVEDQRRKEAAQGPKREPITLERALDTYWQNVAKDQPSARTTRSQKKSLLDFFGANALMSSISQAKLEAYRSTRRKEASVATVNRALQLYRRVWRYCNDIINADVGQEPKWKKLIQREPSERVRELTCDEEARLLEHLRPDFHAFVRFCLATGMRVSSAMSICWDDVSFNEMAVRIRIKGGGVQIVPLTQRTAAIIRSQPRVAEQVFTFESHRNRGDVRKGQRYPITYGALKAVWKPALDAAGIRDFRFHDTRHTAATRTLRASGNMKAVQKLLGHASITTTARYAHALLEDVRDALEKAEV